MDFSAALAAWRDVDLPALQTHLDSIVAPLTDLQTHSLQSRKNLADKTREFKKLSDEAKLEGYKPLLKAYQAEIDGLTRRARDAEGGVRQVDERLRGVADPAAILNSVVDQTVKQVEVESLRQDMQHLAEENARYKEEARSAAQLQRRNDELSHRISSLESSFEKKLQEARTAAETETVARFDERLSNAQARESELSRSLSVAQEQLKQLRTSHENTTERLLTSSNAAGAATSSSAEYEMLAEDLQRARERVATVEKRNEQLREEVEKVKSGQSDEKRNGQLESDVKTLTAEKADLSARIEHQEQEHRTSMQVLGKRVTAAEQTADEKSKEATTLRAKLEAQADYTELKRELQIMRVVEFSNGIDDDEQIDGDSGAKPLEALLLQKNRKLQDDLTSLRVAYNELEVTSKQQGQDGSRLQAELSQAKQLNEKLERDLLQIAPGSQREDTPSNGDIKATAAQGTTPQSAEEALEEMSRIEKGELGLATSADRLAAGPAGSPDPNGEVTSRAKPGVASSSLATPTPVSTPAQASGDSSVLPIIISQRDRFRSRNAELEEELRKQFEAVTQLRNDVKSLQSDNLSLYEKVRYLQSYSASGSAGSSRPLTAAARNEHRFPPSSPTSAHHHRDQATRVPLNLASASVSGEDKWRDKYEQSMNPFEVFRGREQSRAVSSLNPLERLLHMSARLVLADRRMRLLFVCYFIGMHVFVFAVLVDYTFYGSSTTAAAAAAAAMGSGVNCAAPMEPVPNRT
ncbi:unnamed protein product [Parajaminaea phylloscopi]